MCSTSITVPILNHGSSDLASFFFLFRLENQKTIFFNIKFGYLRPLFRHHRENVDLLSTYDEIQRQLAVQLWLTAGSDVSGQAAGVRPPDAAASSRPASLKGDAVLPVIRDGNLLAGFTYSLI